ncbi:MAG: L,D-transpeptidase family protein [Nocardioides sp.]
MTRRLVLLVVALVLGATMLTALPASAQAREPRWARHLPDQTTQVVRTVSSRKYCSRIWCTVTQAWKQDRDGHWTRVRSFRSTIGSNGWGKQREGDRRSPNGVFEIKTTFTTGTTNPGRMRWRQRKPTSVVTAAAGPNYNTWLEVRGVTSGNRPSMRSGWVVDYNNVRLRPGVGARPVPGKGSGIFYHTSKPGSPWAPTAGCTQVGNPEKMRWLLTWLRPGAKPRVVQNR